MDPDKLYVSEVYATAGPILKRVMPASSGPSATASTREPLTSPSSSLRRHKGGGKFMGQKVNPHGMRVGVIKDWDSRWYARDEKVGDLIVED